MILVGEVDTVEDDPLSYWPEPIVEFVPMPEADKPRYLRLLWDLVDAHFPDTVEPEQVDTNGSTKVRRHLAKRDSA